MVLDAILAPLLALAEWLVDQLPTADVAWPALDGVLELLAKVNSIVPIGPVVGVAVAILSAALVFVVVRAVLTIWHIVYP